jgi:nitrogen fixation/metabolism regulation signal transduction histidine kinase
MTTDLHIAETPAFLKAMLDAMPLSVFVVDAELSIVEMNATARREFAGAGEGVRYRSRGGQAWDCLSGLCGEDGCGTGAACRYCVIRDAVAAVADGKEAFRRKFTTQVLRDGQETEAHLLVTVNALPAEVAEGLFLLTLEDVTELVTLRGLVPICSHCKKIRNDDDFWEHIETYLKHHLDVDFSHGICPDCLQEHYPRPAKPTP